MTDKPDNNTEDNTSGFCKSVPTEKPRESAIEVIKDPSHPHASPRSGVIPPVATRFQKGNKLGGRPSAGASVKEWYNEMASDEWSRERLERAVKSRKSSPAKVAAAQEWLRAMDARDGDSGKSADRIIEHTEGKAAQQVKHEHTGMAGLGIVVRVEGMATPELPPAPGEAKKLANQDTEGAENPPLDP